ncbi:hypothetical protein ABEB36_001823 [Hypothenemus hampei]|uniref:Proteasome assembly chaperone 4 n=1 Tax=Hypothenemus hampei TaxID=57062 RepID=A0ABD1FFU1_HYPHA
MAKNEMQIEFVTSTFTTHTFQQQILDTKVDYQITNMNESMLITISQMDMPQFQSMSMALKRNGNRTLEPYVAVLYGACNVDEIGHNLAAKIAKKLEKRVIYLILNVTDSTKIMIPEIEKRLYNEIKQFPSKFGL